MIAYTGLEVKGVFSNLKIHISSLKVKFTAKIVGWKQSDMTCLCKEHSH